MLCLGVSIIEDGGDSITMELEMDWDGNPSIILAIKSLIGVALPVQVNFNLLPACFCSMEIIFTFRDKIFLL